MYVLSAAQAISPAIERTRRTLFRPFRLGTFLKLCAIAVFTEGFGGNFNFSTPSGSSSHHADQFAPPNLTPGLIAIIVAGLLVALIVTVLLFYLVTRLRFALFHCLTHQVSEIKPGWRLYRNQANRFFRLNIVLGMLFLFVVIVIAAPFAAGFYRVFQESRPGAFHFGLFFALFLPLFALIFLLIFAALIADIVLRDFMLPHFALEDATGAEAWAIVRTRIAAEKGSFVLYAFLRVLLPFAAMIALIMVLAIPMIIVFAILAAFFAGFHALIAAAAVRIVLGVVLGVIALAFALLIAICFGGPLSIWVRNYALVFYGSRYPLLGRALYPPPPQPLYAAEGFPSA